MRLSIEPVAGIGEISPGDDFAGMLAAALAGLGPTDADIVVVTHKVVSKSEGAVVELADDGPDAHRRLVEDEAVRIVRRRGNLVIAETRHGFICANAGIDRSNAAPGTAVLLPEDPDRSARRLRDRLGAELGVRPAVVITDTFGRPWRRGLVDVAIGVAGMSPITDLRGTTDSFGRVLDVTEVNLADEVAAAADLVMGKATGICAALVRGVEFAASPGSVQEDVIRPPEEDLFR
ncbi:MAG TPA: coenzyme F420-0:L-glutamate ligase [Acidimicrobiia bacterium]|nr:coenzyme F420-0:L-glutamate ligase [Acidimicrobiia bacterium]